MKVSIITSLYKSSQFVQQFYTEYLAQIKKIGVEYEFVFVDDGCPDDSVKRVLELKEVDSNIKMVCLSRNFGQYAAIVSGLSVATGDKIYVCDIDMEDPVEIILNMYTFLEENKEFDMVYSYFVNRNGGLIRGGLGRVFYKFFNYLSDIKIKENQSWQRMMTKRYLDSFLQFRENETLPSALFTLNGYKTHTIQIDRKYKGYTSYSMKKRLNQAFDGLISFTSRPLLMISKLGFFITSIAFFFMLCIIYSKIFISDFQAGWASLIVSIWLVGGIILFAIGIIGLYLSKIFNQVKSRPLFIIKEIL